MCVYVCVCTHTCPAPNLLITGGMIWLDMNAIWLVKQVSCYMVAVVIIIRRHGLRIEMHCM